MRPTVLIVPGWMNSGPDHWQTRWERAHADYRRVEQRDWDRPNRDEWVAALDVAIASAGGPVVLVAHSLGCHAIAQWAAQHGAECGGSVRGALLVAPPSDEGIANTPEMVGFLPVPRLALPFPSILVASGDDPYCALGAAEAFAEAWGSRFISIGAHGHINTDAGFGPWPEGEALLAELIAEVAGDPDEA